MGPPGMHAELEARRHAEVAASAAQAPQQLPVETGGFVIGKEVELELDVGAVSSRLHPHRYHRPL
jgi:hypothetical protein